MLLFHFIEFPLKQPAEVTATNSLKDKKLNVTITKKLLSNTNCYLFASGYQMKAQIVQQCKDIFRATEARKLNCTSRLGNAFLTEPRGSFTTEWNDPRRMKRIFSNFLAFGPWVTSICASFHFIESPQQRTLSLSFRLTKSSLMLLVVPGPLFVQFIAQSEVQIGDWFLLLSALFLAGSMAI